MRPQLRHILCWRPSRSLRRNAWQSFVLDHALKYIAQGRAKETVLLLQLSDHADGSSICANLVQLDGSIVVRDICMAGDKPI